MIDEVEPVVAAPVVAPVVGVAAPVLAARAPYDLVVVHAFDGHNKGDIITDAGEYERIMTSHLEMCVVKKLPA